MHIETLRVRNFRRLKDVRIDLASDISIFVGANNSGKTSATEAVEFFAKAARDEFTIHDFGCDSWGAIDAFGEGAADAVLPSISIDLWFSVGQADLHRVIDLLPSLAWEGSLVGLRVEFAASDETGLLTRFRQARDQAAANIRPGQNGTTDYHPWPRTLVEYLTETLSQEFELRHYVLDRAQFDADFIATVGYAPMRLTPDKGRSGKEVLNSIIKVDFLHAQRHLSDRGSESRAESLSRRLSRFYDRNLEKRGDDFDAMRALADSEALLNDHLQRVFEPTLERLKELGYPGVANPRLLIKTALNPKTIMSGNEGGARVHYALGDVVEGVEPPTLPDRYNGLGFKNLIYMVVELLDLHTQWMDIEENRPPLHLVFIEEPEAHLHAQLQQVFIRKVIDILAIEGPDADHYASQIVVTTHSPHILYERGFRPIRYFRRCAGEQSSEVLNLSSFYDQTENPTRDFLERYLKLTHCDLFFADAAILVEGNVERLLMPQMIAKAAPHLQRAYLSILEVGGAFGYRFRTLIEFLGITALIVTDIDSVLGPPAVEGVEAATAEPDAAPEEPGENDGDEAAPGSACMVHIEGSVTSNQTLIQWLPARRLISELLLADAAARTQQPTAECQATIKVTYQTAVDVTWGEATVAMVGRTLEEAFAFENLPWCQHADRADLKLRIRSGATLSANEIAERLHKKIKGSNFGKTDFALALLAQDPNAWTVPAYIANGLLWLQEQVTPPDEAEVVE